MLFYELDISSTIADFPNVLLTFFYKHKVANNLYKKISAIIFANPSRVVRKIVEAEIYSENLKS
jgi:hypothetical protein